jgi:thymidylate synthase (FAD)
MKLIEPSCEILSPIDGNAIMKHIELCGRVCYKSENLINDESCDIFVGKILSSAHESVIEHFGITFKFTGTRGMSHQLVRHRIASYSQESSRYCNYTRKKFGDDIVFIKPMKFDNWSKAQQDIYKNSLEQAETAYKALIAAGSQAQDARGVLPTDLKTEVVCTMNLRTLRHFLKTRTDPHAQLEIRFLANDLLKKLKAELPVLFNDIQETL